MADGIKVNGQVVAKIEPRYPELYHVYNWDKKSNYLNNCCNLKMAGEYISEVPQDCIPYNYHPIFFWKIKKRFWLSSTGSKVSTLTTADISGLTI